MFRLRLEHREGRELRVGHDPADLWETDLGQQRSEPLLLRDHRPHPAWDGVGPVGAVITTPTTFLERDVDMNVYILSDTDALSIYLLKILPHTLHLHFSFS